MRNDTKALNIRHPDYRSQISDDQHDVLGNLGPGHRPHAAEHRAQQNARKAEPDTNFKWNLQRPGSDGSGRVDLCRHISEGRNNQNDHSTKPGGIAAITRSNEVRHGVTAEFAQIRRHQRIHQHIAAGPANHESQITMTTEINAAGQRHERGAGHPVRRGRHAVEHRRHLASGNVIGAHLHGP